MELHVMMCLYGYSCFYGLSTSRCSITYYGILLHITPWAVTELHVMIYYCMGFRDMMLYGMMSHGIVWFSLALPRGVARRSGWLYDESWVCGLDLMLAYAMSLLHVIDSVSSFSYVLVCLGGWVYG
jgi:hypothetical protein